MLPRNSSKGSFPVSNPDFEYPVGSMVGGATGLIGTAVFAAFQGAQNSRLAAQAAGHEAMQDVVIAEWLESYEALHSRAEAEIASREKRIRELEQELADANDKLLSIAIIRAQARRARGR